MITHVKTTVEKLTPALVRTHASLTHWVGERPIKERRIAYLEKCLLNDLFFPARWRVASLNGTDYGVDGQHSGEMWNRNIDKIPPGMLVIIDHFKVDSQDDLRSLFNMFDSWRNVRSTQDHITSHKQCAPSLSDASTGQVQKALRGICFVLQQETPGIFQAKEDRYDLVEEYPSFIEWAAPLVSNKILSRGPVVGAMMSTWSVNATVANLFWREVLNVSEGSGTAKTAQPIKKLSMFLMETKEAGSKKASGCTARGFYVKSILAWNAFRKGTDTALAYRPKAPLPEVLK